jgi:type I restriction enzyme S subunit
MSKPTNKIDKLIAKLCPQGVEFKELGEVAQYSRQRIAAADLNNENYVGVDNLLPNKQGKTKSNYVPTKGKLTRFESGDVLLGNIRPYLKKIWRATHTGGTNGDVLAIQINNKEMLQSEFLYYLLSSDDFFNFDMKFAKGAKMPRGNKSAILNFKVPIPPLTEQQRIVAILDKFDALVNDIFAGLPAELNARRKQYEYYRDKLLTFQEFPSSRGQPPRPGGHPSRGGE